jgi:hypothetical protein
MPKRTNPFQKMILRVYRQMSLPDDKVEESAMVKERGSAVKREVDLLLQRRVFGTDLRIAVECRSRKDKDDIEWIDSLIGKYRDLDIHKVVAVSRLGFTPAAKEKAAVNRIDTLTLEQALETNWPKEFTRLGIGSWVRSDKPQSVTVVTEPPLPSPLSLETMVFTTTGQEIATIERVAKTIYEKWQKGLHQAIGEKFLDFFKTVHDLNTKSILSEITEKPAFPSFIKGEDQQQYRIESFTLRIQSSFSAEPVTTEHYILGDAQVTLATIEAGKGAFSVMAVQVADKPNEAKLHVALVKTGEPEKQS